MKKAAAKKKAVTDSPKAAAAEIAVKWVPADPAKAEKELIDLLEKWQNKHTLDVIRAIIEDRKIDAIRMLMNPPKSGTATHVGCWQTVTK